MSKRIAIDDVEKKIQNITSQFPFVQDTKTTHKTPHTLKMRLVFLRDVLFRFTETSKRKLLIMLLLLDAIEYMVGIVTVVFGIDILKTIRMTTTLPLMVQEK